MRRVLITGGRGFIGRHTIDPLLQRDFEVHATASTDDIPPELAILPVTWHVCDLLKREATDALFAKVSPSHLLHTAWITDHSTYWTSSDNLSWVAATMDMLRAFSDAGGKRYVCAGTCAEYEWSTDTYDEASSAADPSTLYGKSKLAVHDLATAAGTQLNLSTATGRIFFAYGPFENASRIIPYTCRMLSLGAPALFTSGNLERDFVHVRDAGEGFAALIDSELTGAVNIASGTGVKLGTIVAKLGKIAGSEGLIELGARPDRPDDPPKMVAHIDRILSTGWRPSVSLDQGLADTFHWWKRQSTTNI